MRIGGTVGLSMGVFTDGKAHYVNLSYRDFEHKLPIPEETIFAACSLTKAVTAALVEKGKFGWDTLVKDVLPDCNIEDDILRNKTTITDLHVHRTGMSISYYWPSSDNAILISQKDSMTRINHQVSVNPFRGQFQYNNLRYELAGHIIERLSKSKWVDLMESRILQPLEIPRSSLRVPGNDVEN